MMLGLLRGTLALLTIGGMIVAARELAGRGAPVELPERQPVGGRVADVAVLRPDPAHVERALERPAFRADRRRSALGYDAAKAMEADAPPPPAPPKPALALSGIVWGSEPAALVEGVPGSEGSTVLRKGDSVAGLRLVRIGREAVVIRGMDTTWNLTVRNPWP